MTPREALNRILASKELQAYEARLRRVTAFHVLAIDARETSHAALLAWILDPRASHGIGTEPLRRFLLMIASHADATVLDAIEIETLDLDEVIVETEVPIVVPPAPGVPSVSRRLDVVVSLALPGQDTPSVIAVIEYKVDAEEGDAQTSDYARWCATLQIGGNARGALPLQAFVCPVVDEEASPAKPFVPIGYDEYLEWIDAVRALSMTQQAKFLLDEWRECIAVREDVGDAAQKELGDLLRSAHAQAVKVLVDMSPLERQRFADVLRLHKDAFARIGIVPTRQAKGYSAAVVAMRDALTQRLDGERWSFGESVGSLRGAFLPSVSAVAQCTGSERLSGLRLQVFAERPKRGTFGVVLEVIGEVPPLDFAAGRELRIQLANDLRAEIRKVDPNAPFRSNATALRFPISMPEITDVESDTDERVSTHADQLREVAERLSVIEPRLLAWAENALTTRLREALARQAT